MSETPEVNGKLVDQRVDRLVDNFIKIRDAIYDLEAKAEAFIAPYKAQKEKLAEALLKALEANGAEMMRTKYGTVSKLVTHTAPLTDPDAFMVFVQDNELFHLLERRASSTAVLEYAKEHAGTLPPGVKLNPKRGVGVRSA